MQKVTAALIEKDGRFLIAKRKKGKHLGEKWEFPGGKVDPGETPEQCLKRELAEELSIEARIGAFVGSAMFTRREIRFELLLYRAEHLSGDFRLTDHEELSWALPGELLGYDLADSDRVLVEELMLGSTLPRKQHPP